MQDFFENDSPSHIVPVLVSKPVSQCYSYVSEEALEPGTYLRVPLGSNSVLGVVWDTQSALAAQDKVPDIKKLKPVDFVFAEIPPMPAIHRQFIERLARYTLSAAGAVLKMSLSSSNVFNPPQPVAGYKRISGVDPDKLTDKRRKVWEALEDGEAMRASELARAAGCSSSVIRTMADQDLLREVEMSEEGLCARPDPAFGKVTLNEDQTAAAAPLIQAVMDEKFSVTLLDGVTGSGKTEVYFEAVSQALAQGKQALILLPEITLSNAFLSRFEKRYGCAPALWHSGLTPAQRRIVWRGVACGETKVVIGARSALMLPFPNLGLIVVDEEHDQSFKQEEGVIYHARDMAVMRSYLTQIPCVLVSATPSLETLQNVVEGRYARVLLENRFGSASLPDVHIIDMRDAKEDAQHFLSQELKEAMTATIEKEEQVLLFLNRRGYAPLTLCRSCGHRYECPRCSAWMVMHQNSNQLSCHHCGHKMRVPKSCLKCEETESLVPCGPGVERIAEEVGKAFPEARMLVLSSDTAEDHKSLRDTLRRIQRGEVDIIIGTQIVAKGHHFPKLTCVGVVDADLGLAGGDPRAGERTWQLLHQVSGRAGREQAKGHVYLQSFHPDNPVIQSLASHDRERFVMLETENRQAAFLPPFSRLAALIISGPKEQEVAYFARTLIGNAPQGEGVTVLGPAQAPIYKLRNHYRYRFLVIADKGLDLQKAVRDWLSVRKVPSKIKLRVDIDPLSFL